MQRAKREDPDDLRCIVAEAAALEVVAANRLRDARRLLDAAQDAHAKAEAHARMRVRARRRAEGRLLRAMREKVGMSVNRLGDLCGWSGSLLNYMERGMRWNDDAAADARTVLERRCPLDPNPADAAD